jgi:SAM-dependent methyltransferase
MVSERGAAGAGPRRLNWGCGDHTAAGWINSDIKPGPAVDLVADVRQGLPLATGGLDYAVSIHALPELSYPQLVPALVELRRVLKPGAVLRLALPDLDRGIDAYRRGERSYFKVDADEVRSDGGRLIAQMLWYGYSRSLFTLDFAEELLEKAGFEAIRACAFGETASGLAGIVELDNREDESIFVEGSKPGGDGGGMLPYNRAVPGELEILDVAQDPSERIRGHFQIRKTDGAKLAIVGWVLGRDSPAIGVEIVSGGSVAGRASVVLDRPDVAERFPDVKEAATAGFQLELSAQGRGESELQVWAQLKDRSREPLGRVVVKAGRRGLLGALRRG